MAAPHHNEQHFNGRPMSAGLLPPLKGLNAQGCKLIEEEEFITPHVAAG
jgi:hypothetical protein